MMIPAVLHNRTYDTHDDVTILAFIPGTPDTQGGDWARDRVRGIVAVVARSDGSLEVVDPLHLKVKVGHSETNN